MIKHYCPHCGNKNPMILIGFDDDELEDTFMCDECKHTIILPYPAMDTNSEHIDPDLDEKGYDKREIGYNSLFSKCLRYLNISDNAIEAMVNKNEGGE